LEVVLKDNLQAVVTNLDTQAETRLLKDEERNHLETARDELIKLLHEEELKYYQMAKVNTRYFQIVANGKHHKKHIFSLEHEGGKIEGQHNLKCYITQQRIIQSSRGEQLFSR
jgi:N-acetylglucosamine kinase-like BadF-type ATPase